MVDIPTLDIEDYDPDLNEEQESVEDKSGIHFIHLNHTNPALSNNSNAQDHIKDTGFNIAQIGQAFKL